MNWLTNGSKTLVTCFGVAGFVCMACFKVIDGPAAVAGIGSLTALYFGANLYQNGQNGKVQ